MRMDWLPRGKFLAVIATMLLLAVAFAACGGDDDSGSGTETTASTEEAGGGGGGSAEEVAADALAVAEEHTEVTQIGPTEPIKGEIPKGKKLIYVNCGQPACTTQGEAFAEAAKVLGWTTEEIPAEPTPESIQAAFDEVIRRAPDGVASAGFAPELYPKQIAKLNDMKIPVFEATGGVGTGKEGVTYDPLGPEEAAAAMAILANKTIYDMGGEGEAANVLLTGYPIVKTYSEGWANEITDKCSECTVKTLEVQPTSIGKDAPEIITNFLRANPDVKAVLLSYDLLGSGLPAALKNAGLEMPLTYSWGVDAPGIEALQTEERTAAAPDPYNEVGWQQIDGFARLFAGEDPVQPWQEPIIWSNEFENVPEETEPFPAINPNYQEQFKELWGVK